MCVRCLRLRCSLLAGREAWRAAEAGGQQDGVRAARLPDCAGRRLRARARAVPRVEALQGVHVQLGAQVDEHRSAPRGPAAQAARNGRLCRLLQGRLRDHPQKVRMSLSLTHTLIHVHRGRETTRETRVLCCTFEYFSITVLLLPRCVHIRIQICMHTCTLKTCNAYALTPRPAWQSACEIRDECLIRLLHDLLQIKCLIVFNRSSLRRLCLLVPKFLIKNRSIYTLPRFQNFSKLESILPVLYNTNTRTFAYVVHVLVFVHEFECMQ